MTDIIEVNDADALDEYAGAWADLFSHTPGASFFQTLPWLQIYWRHFGADQKLRVLVVSDAGSPVGIVPLVVRREKYRAGYAHVLTYPLDDWGSFYGPIGRHVDQCLGAALRYIWTAPRDWDMLDLRWEDPDHHLSADGSSLTQGVLRDVGSRIRTHVWKQTAVVDTQGSWEGYLAGRNAKFRSGIRRSIRRADDVGKVTYERFRPQAGTSDEADPRLDLYDACADLAELSWQGSSDSGTTLSHPRVRQFLRECHAQAAELGMLDINSLYIDKRLVAFAYNYHHQGLVYGLRVGFHPKFAKVGIGKVLWAQSFEDSFRRGDTMYDIGPDTLEIKKHWLTRVIPVRGYTYYSPWSPQSQLVRASHWIQDAWTGAALRKTEDGRRKTEDFHATA